MAGKIQNADIKTLTELQANGADKPQLINTDKLYVPKTGIQDVLDTVLRKNNDSAIIDPVAANDSAEGYEVGSRWVNSVNGKIYFCFDNTAGAAVWSEAGGGGGVGSLSTYYSEDVEGLSGSEFSCLDGGVIGAGNLITSFVGIDTTNPLDGNQSLTFTIPASGAGKYCLLDSAFQIPVPLYAQSKSSLFTFESSSTGNYKDFSLFLWDDTANATIKGSDGNTLFIDLDGGQNSNRLWFNTILTANLRWGIMINNSNTGAILKLDNLQIDGSPDKEISVYASSEWKSFTPTGAWAGTYTGMYRRVGDSMEIKVYFSSSGSQTGDLTINMPNGFSIDTSKEIARDVGTANFVEAGTREYVGSARIFGSANTFKFFHTEASGAGNVNATSPFTWDSGDELGMRVVVPILGWSDKEANVKQSISETKLAYVETLGTLGGTVTGGVTDIPFTAISDSKGLWNGTQFTADRDMVVSLSGSVYFANNGVQDIYAINITTGTTKYVGGSNEGTSTSNSFFSGIISLKAGDVLALRTNTTDTVSTSAPDRHTLTIKEVADYASIISLLGEKYLEVYASSDWKQMDASAGIFIKGITTNPTYGTVSNNQARYRRDGSDLLIEWDFSQTSAGGIGAGAYLIDISQLGLTIDTNQKPINTSTDTAAVSEIIKSSIGSASFNYSAGAAASLAQGTIVPYSPTQAKVLLTYTTANGQVNYDNWGTFYNFGTNPMSITASMRIPIVGWSNVNKNVTKTSNETTLAYVEAAGNTGQAVTAAVTDIPFTTISNNKGLWNGSQFTADRDMVISIEGSILKSGNNTNFWANFYLNGLQYKNGGHRSAAAQDITHFSEQFALKSGDVLSLRLEGISTTLVNSSVYHHLSIKELPDYDKLIQMLSQDISIYASSDWKTYTPADTSGLGTITNNELKWRRNGSDIEIIGGFTTGNVTSAIAHLSLPNNLVSADTATRKYVGSLARVAVSTSYKVMSISGVGYLTFGGGATSHGDLDASSMVGSNEHVYLHATVPILGWSDKEDNVVVSGTKATYAYVEAAGNGGGNLPAGQDIPFITVDDAKGLWNGTQFTADRDMIVEVSGQNATLASYSDTVSYKINGTFKRKIGSYQDTPYECLFNAIIKLKDGDILSFSSDSDHDMQPLATVHHLTIKELPNYEDLILAYLDESSVVSSYISSAAQTFTSGVAADIIYETVVDDKNLDYNSTTGVYTAPVSGNYLVTASLSINKTVTGGTSLLELVPVNYTGNRLRGNRVDDSSLSLSGNVITGVVNLKKGYQFKISYFGTNSGVITKEETQDANSFSIHRIR